MDERAFLDAVAPGYDAVSPEADLVCLGEMGIGNTTAAAAIAAALFGGGGVRAGSPGAAPASTIEGLARKRAVDRSGARAACARILGDPLRVAAALGGRELAAILGATLAARQMRIPVLLDGFVCTAAVAPLAKLRADALDHALAGACFGRSGSPRPARRARDGAAARPRHAARRRLGRGARRADPARGARLPHRHGDLQRGRRLGPPEGDDRSQASPAQPRP